MVNLKIDDVDVKIRHGATILDVAKDAGIRIPTLCHNDAISPYGACRLCTVEIETKRGKKRMVASCLYPVEEGLKVLTNSERVRKARKMIIELLLSRCPEVKILQDLAKEYEIEKPRFSLKKENCILCGMCVRVCTERLNIGAIGFVNRGVIRKIGVPFSEEYSESCVGCGACTYVCPTGAIQMEAKTLRKFRTLDGEQRKCRYMMMGIVDYKLCPKNYECYQCEIDQRMEETYGMHPALAISRIEEPIVVDEFILSPSLYYFKGHVWVGRLNGKIRLGIDDFARRLIGSVNDIKFSEINSELKNNEIAWEITVGKKKAMMLSPINGKIVDINPEVMDNPKIVSCDPYERGWVYTIEPTNLEEDLRKLLSRNKAKEWLRQDSGRLHARLQKDLGVTITDGGEIAPTLHKRLDEKEWSELMKEFFLV